MDWFKLTAPCGIDCFNCNLYEKNITEEWQREFATKLGKKPEEIPCGGCRKQCCSFMSQCATRDCVQKQEVEFCFQCSEFPCEKLAPCAQGAERYPHNFKLFNLCRIQKVGLKEWAEKEAGDIRQKYFQGKFVIGVGPIIE